MLEIRLTAKGETPDELTYRLQDAIEMLNGGYTTGVYGEMSFTTTGEEEGEHEIYQCEKCDLFHPVDHEGDCTDESARYKSTRDYANRKGLDPDSVFIVDDPNAGGPEADELNA